MNEPLLPIDLSPEERDRPTLKTIAQATGLAVATVSRALKDAPDIGEATKTRVRDMALELGYRPNRAGVRLRTGKTNVIALVLSAESDVMNNTAKLMYSIAQALRGTAYHMVVMPYFADQDMLDPIRYIVETGSADGVIFNQTRPDDPRIAYLTRARLPFATHGRTETGIEHAFFDYDNDAFGRLAVRALAQQGRRNLYLIAPPLGQTYALHTINGCKSEAAELGLTLEVAEVNSDAGSDAIHTAIRARFARADRPDGVVSASTTGAMAAVAGIEAQGLHLGTDFDLATKEAIQFMHRFRPEIIVASEDVSAAGDFLARAVIAAIEGKPALAGQRLQCPKREDFRTLNGPVFG